jgi:MbtH protein
LSDHHFAPAGKESFDRIRSSNRALRVEFTVSSVDRVQCSGIHYVEENIGMDVPGDKDIFTVVVNHEVQYSIWSTHKPVPEGWREVGKQGEKSECLAYIKDVWTDLRPLSLRQEMAALES